MDRTIHVGLERVARRFRSVRLAWLLSLLWACLAIVFSLIHRFAINSENDLSRVAVTGADLQLPILGTVSLITLCWYAAIVLAIIVTFLCLQSYKNKQWTAIRIEEHHPDLKQRLLTVLDPNQTYSSPFLRKQLEAETVEHAQEHRWSNTVPSTRLITAWSVQLVALLLAFYAGAKVANSSNTRELMLGRGTKLPASDISSIEILPGDVEIERGTDIVITARFPLASIPTDVWVESTASHLPPSNNLPHREPSLSFSPPSLATVNARINLQKSLSDPVFGGTVRRISQDLDYKVLADGFESALYKIKVFDFPQLVRADVEVHSPPYAKKETDTGPRLVEDTRRVTVAEGSELKWTLFVNKTLTNVSMRNTESGEVLALQQSSNSESHSSLEWTAAMTASRSSQWELELVDADGRNAKFKERFHIKVIPNLPPTIQLTNASDLTASPLQELTLQAKLKNEFEVKRAGITIFSDESTPLEFELEGTRDKSGATTVEHRLDLETLNAQPDDFISYYFWAEDLDTNGEIRRTEGEMFFVEVRPFEEIYREGNSGASEEQSQSSESSANSQAAAQAENLAELQKKIISGTWNLLRSVKSRSSTISAERLPAPLIGDESIATLVESQSQALELTAPLDSSVQDQRSRVYIEDARKAMRDAKQYLESASEGDPIQNLTQALSSEKLAYESLLKLRAREHSIVRSRQQSSSSQSQSSSQQNRQQQIDQLELDEDDSNYQNQQQASESGSTNNEQEARQVMNRLDELARRQKDLNEQLKQMESALREAKTEEERQELEEQLKRLRENQEEMLRDTDELIDRMNQPQNRQTMEKSREQVENVRDQLQQSNQALSQNETSAALNSGSRALEQMNETREQLRQESATQLQQSMQNLLDQSRRVQEQHRQLQNDLDRGGSNQANSSRRGNSEFNENEITDSENNNVDSAVEELTEDATPLRPQGASRDGNENQEAWAGLKNQVEQLLEDVQKSVETAESSEPLLAEQLYESFRQTKQNKVEEKLDQVRQLVERGLFDPAKSLSDEAGNSIDQLTKQIESASEQILGSEQESLRRALREIDESRNELSELATESEDTVTSQPLETDEQSRAPGNGQDETQTTNAAENPSEVNNQSPANNTPSNGDASTDADAPNEALSPSYSSSDQSNSEEPGSNQSRIESFLPNRSPSQSSSSRGEASPSQNGPANESSSRQGSNRDSRGALNRPLPADSPLTGGDYQKWSDRLRDAEELIRDENLRLELTQVREAAREMRIQYRRHSKVPEWDLVDQLIAEPLHRIREKVNEELLRNAAEKNALVPIDRDPVPSQFQRQLEQYYENLGRSAPQP